LKNNVLFIDKVMFTDNIMTSVTNYPIAKRVPHTVEFGAVEGEDRGDNIMKSGEKSKVDNYYWLRDDKREDPEMIEYLEKENDYTKAVLFNNPSNKKKYDEIKASFKSNVIEDYESVKLLSGCQLGSYTYTEFYRNKEGVSHKLHYMEITDKTSGVSTEHLLLDENSYKNPDPKIRCDISNVVTSYHHKYIMFGLDTTGTENYDIMIFDISDPSNIRPVEHNLPKILYASFDVTHNEQFIIYTMCDTVNRKDSVHIYDVQSKKSVEIFRDDTITNSVVYRLSGDDKFAFVCTSNYDTRTVHYVDLEKCAAMCAKHGSLDVAYVDVPVIHHGINDDKVTVAKIGEHFVILTNRLDSDKYMENIPVYCSISNPKMQNWVPLDMTHLKKKLSLKVDDVLHYKNVRTFEGFIMVEIVHNGVIKFAHTSYGKGSSSDPFGEDWFLITAHDECGVLKIHDINYGRNEVVFLYSSLVTPNAYMKYNMGNEKCDIMREEVIPNYDPSNFVSEKIYVSASDGQKIPVSIVHHKDLTKDNGPHKLHLYGYGAYGYTIDPSFDKTIIPFVKEKFVYAITHVRGSRAMGNQWYEDGKMMKKLNTFTDFDAVAKHFVDTGYTTPKLLSAEGRSAGGLLAGFCVATLGHRFNAVISGVPFVDVLTTMSDPSIPLTSMEWNQWGNPNNADQHEYMKVYSPYDCIKVGTNYPNYYVQGGLHDPRVGYWEPAKFVAKLRHAQGRSNGKIQLLEIKMNDGHFDSSDRYRWIDEKARSLLFLINSANPSF
jgi:oligopeptidase B